MGNAESYDVGSKKKKPVKHIGLPKEEAKNKVILDIKAVVDISEKRAKIVVLQILNFWLPGISLVPPCLGSG